MANHISHSISTTDLLLFPGSTAAICRVTLFPPPSDPFSARFPLFRHHSRPFYSPNWQSSDETVAKRSFNTQHCVAAVIVWLGMFLSYTLSRNRANVGILPRKGYSIASFPEARVRKKGVGSSDHRNRRRNARVAPGKLGRGG